MLAWLALPPLLVAVVLTTGPLFAHPGHSHLALRIVIGSTIVVGIGGIVAFALDRDLQAVGTLAGMVLALGFAGTAAVRQRQRNFNKMSRKKQAHVVAAQDDLWRVILGWIAATYSLVLALIIALT